MSESCCCCIMPNNEMSGVLTVVTSFTLATVNARGRKWEAAYLKDG